MNRSKFLFGGAVLAALQLIQAHPAFADDRKDQREAQDALARGEVLPLPRILAIVSRRHPGNVLNVELQHPQGQLQYEVRILGREGQVSEIDIDARTGDILRVGGADARVGRRR